MSQRSAPDLGKVIRVGAEAGLALHALDSAGKGHPDQGLVNGGAVVAGQMVVMAAVWKFLMLPYLIVTGVVCALPVGAAAGISLIHHTYLNSYSSSSGSNGLSPAGIVFVALIGLVMLCIWFRWFFVKWGIQGLVGTFDLMLAGCPPPRQAWRVTSAPAIAASWSLEDLLALPTAEREVLRLFLAYPVLNGYAIAARVDLRPTRIERFFYCGRTYANLKRTLLAVRELKKRGLLVSTAEKSAPAELEKPRPRLLARRTKVALGLGAAFVFALSLVASAASGTSSLPTTATVCSVGQPGGAYVVYRGATAGGYCDANASESNGWIPSAGLPAGIRTWKDACTYETPRHDRVDVYWQMQPARDVAVKVCAMMQRAGLRTGVEAQ